MIVKLFCDQQLNQAVEIFGKELYPLLANAFVSSNELIAS
jgi:hypothetical protein